MDDLISRISLKQSIVTSLILGWGKTLEQIIDEEPTIDAVPVVRCKECKFSYTMITARSKDGQERWTRFCDKHKNWYPKDDWFCASGKREEE